MAISKRVQLDNGVTVYYHRVASVTITTNVQNTIEVQSYTSKEKREEEEAWYASMAEGEDTGDMDVFISTAYYAAPYDEAMSVDGAYQWLQENVPELAEGEEE